LCALARQPFELRDAKTLNVVDGATNTTRPQIQAGTGPLVAVNPTTDQVILAGP
jgi:hypothetical protein